MRNIKSAFMLPGCNFLCRKAPARQGHRLSAFSPRIFANVKAVNSNSTWSACLALRSELLPRRLLCIFRFRHGLPAGNPVIRAHGMVSYSQRRGSFRSSTSNINTAVLCGFVNGITPRLGSGCLWAYHAHNDLHDSKSCCSVAVRNASFHPSNFLNVNIVRTRFKSR